MRNNMAATTASIINSTMPTITPAANPNFNIADWVKTYQNGIDWKQQQADRERRQKKLEDFAESYKNNDQQGMASAYAYLDPKGAMELQSSSQRTPDKIRQFEILRQRFGDDTAAQMVWGAKNNVNVNVNGGAQETEFMKQAGKDWAGRYSKIWDASAGARNDLSSLDALAQAIDDPNVYQGAGGETINALQKLGNSLGLDVKGLDNAAIINSVSSQLMGNLRKDLMPGPMSDRDIEFLKNVVTGLGKTPEQNRAIVNVLKKAAQRKVEIGQLADKYMGANNGVLDYRFNQYLQDYYKDKPLFSDEERSAAMGARGKTSVPKSLAGFNSQKVNKKDKKASGGVIDYTDL